LGQLTGVAPGIGFADVGVEGAFGSLGVVFIIKVVNGHLFVVALGGEGNWRTILEASHRIGAEQGRLGRQFLGQVYDFSVPTLDILLQFAIDQEAAVTLIGLAEGIFEQDETQRRARIPVGKIAAFSGPIHISFKKQGLTEAIAEAKVFDDFAFFISDELLRNRREQGL
jgi:hypothetical protein